MVASQFPLQCNRIVQEPNRMTKETSARKSWSRPKVRRLGDIKDVAGPSGTGAQAGGGGQNRS